MKRLIILLCAIPLLFFATSYVLRDNDNLSKIILSAVVNYENLREQTPQTYQAMDSWLYEEGMRSKYAILKSLARIDLLENMTGVKVFKSGPHTNGLNYKAGTMGYYNPEFLDISYTTLEKLFGDEEFKADARVLYEKRFKNMLRVYYVVYHEKNNIKITSSEPKFSSTFKDYDIYEAHTAKGFWSRRNIDGTDGQFLDLLKLVFKHLDPAFVPQDDLVDEYYFSLNNKQLFNDKYFIVRNKSNEYGLVDENHKVILKPAFDKIYNPDLTLLNCLEVKKGSKVGLFNYTTGQLLAPRFDYIIPSSNVATGIGYGSENGELVELNASDLSSWKSSQSSPWQLFAKSLPFSTQSEAPKVYINDGSKYPETMVIVPSYIEYLKVFSVDKFSDELDRAYGKATIINERSISDKIKAFFVSVYEQSYQAGEETVESQHVLVYNTESATINSVNLDKQSSFDDGMGYDASSRFVSNTLIEVKSIVAKAKKGLLMQEVTNFSYYQVSAQGEVKPLQSARLYDFTKFVKIDTSYFKGFFMKRMAEPTQHHNMYISSHLTIADLDIMRNEIFAEYGYKFKSEKWQKYFAKQSWYNPRYDDVNDQLTEIDKANVATILKRKAAMQGNEEAFTKKEPFDYHPVG